MNKGKRADVGALAESDVIVCGPARGEGVGGAVMCLGMALIFGVLPWLTLPPSGKQDTRIIAGMCSILGLVFLALAVVALVSLREYVRADADGLKWRRWRGPEGHLAWDDVDDYHGRATQSVVATGQRTVAGGRVIGRDGTWFDFSMGWVNSALLGQRIKERAVYAKAHDWVRQGARPHDGWPRTFHYQTFANRIASWLVVPLAVSGTIYAIVRLYQTTVIYVPLMGWGYCITSVLCGGGVAVAVAAAYCLATVPDRLTRVRMHERLTLDSNGITVTKAGVSWFVEWEQVTAARIPPTRGLMPSRMIVESDVANFDFTPRIKGFFDLREAVIYNAPCIREWQLPEDDNALPTRHVTESDVFVHHYRTQTNRFWFVIGWSIPAAMVLGLAIEWGLGVSLRFLPLTLWTLAMVSPALLWFYGWYHAARIERDGDGLTFYTPFGVRHLLWSQVTDFRMRGDKQAPWGGAIESRAGRFVFFTNISERERLVRAIEAHLPSGKQSKL